jgi:hypothetical protein
MAFGAICPAQLTMEQRVLDFQSIVGLYIKNYGPYAWKQEYKRFDMLDTAPWLEKVRQAKTDREYLKVVSNWVASLDDAHDWFRLPSNFVAQLPFGVDIYEGKLLVDSIDRFRLPAGQYPFAIGYELVSIDGRQATAILEDLIPYSTSANERSTKRQAAALLTLRQQQRIPDAPEVPDLSTVVFRRFDGKLETYRILWIKTGLPLTNVGKLPEERRAQQSEEDSDVPDYMQPLLRLQNCRVDDRAILNIGAVAPVFASSMPPGFVQRLGGLPTHYFYSGTFQAGGYRIGFIRIPSYAPPNQADALNQFRQEIAFFNANTDGLIVDEMRNPGGSVLYNNELLRLLFHYQFDSLGFAVRATSYWVARFSSSVESAKAQGAPQSIIDQLEQIKQKLKEANAANRGVSEPIPLDDLTIARQPVRTVQGDLLSYSKPVMVLIDEFSASGGDAFAAVIQDNSRGILFGYRTMGAGGNVAPYDAGITDAFTTITESLMVRKAARAEKGYPFTAYVENVGVHPEIEVDYMTRENLIQRGRPFVTKFTEAMVDYIRNYNRKPEEAK